MYLSISGWQILVFAVPCQNKEVVSSLPGRTWGDLEACRSEAPMFLFDTNSQTGQKLQPSAGETLKWRVAESGTLTASQLMVGLTMSWVPLGAWWVIQQLLLCGSGSVAARLV